MTAEEADGGRTTEAKRNRPGGRAGRVSALLTRLVNAAVS